MTRLSNALTFERMASALFFLAIAVAACLMPAQNDTWWQLRTGQEIVEGGRIALQDSFSHTVNGGYWPNHEWLSQVILYSVWRAGGMPGLTAFAALVVTAAWLIVWRLTPGATMTRLFLSAVAIGTVSTEWSLRPQIFTLLLLAVTAWLLARGRYWFLPPLFALWANLHGGVVLGGLVVGAHALASVVAARRLLIRPVFVTIACAALTGVTPLGYSLWAEVPQSLDRLKEYRVLEWQPPTLGDPLLAPFWLLAAALVVLTVATRPWRARPTGSTVLVWGALALLPPALTVARNVPYFLVLAVPAVAGLAAPWFERFERSRRRERPAFNLAMVSAAAVAAVLTVAYAWTVGIPKLQWQPLSEDAVAAIESCPDAIYNRYDDGGYLIWFTPRRKVFIDSRQDPYPVELVREHLQIEASGAYERTFSRYAIRCAFLPARSLVARRLESAGWKDLYEDRSWVVLADPVSSSAALQ